MAELRCIVGKCSNSPKYLCPCEQDVLICEKHLGSHIIPDTSKHPVEKLYAKPNQKTVESLKLFLEKHHEELISAKEAVLEKSNFKISKINEFIPKSLKKLGDGIKTSKKMLNTLNDIKKIPKNTNDSLYQALLLSSEEAIGKIKPFMCNISDYQNILKKVFNKVDIESIVDKKIKEFANFIIPSLEKTEKICNNNSDQIKDIEFVLKKHFDAKIKEAEQKFNVLAQQISEKNKVNTNEIGEIKTKISDLNGKLSQYNSCVQNLNKNLKQNSNRYDELEKRLAEMAQQISNKSAENGREIYEMKEKITDFGINLFKIDEKVTEKVASEIAKIKSEFNKFVLKKDNITEIGNLSSGISTLRKKLETYETKCQFIETQIKAISKLNEKIIKDENESNKSNAKKDSLKAASPQRKTLVNLNAVENENHTLSKSQTLKEMALSSPKESALLSKSQITLEIDRAAEKCSNSNHICSFVLGLCSERHCPDCLWNYCKERKYMQKTLYCEHGKKIWHPDMLKLEQNKSLSSRKLEINTLMFERNAQTPTHKQVPILSPSERSAIPTREHKYHYQPDSLKLDSLKTDRFQHTPSRKRNFEFEKRLKDDINNKKL